MNAEPEITEPLNVQGLTCPMPVVETKQATDTLEAGDVLEIVATDRGSLGDIWGWADFTEGTELLSQSDEGDVYRHVVRRTA
jgi:tRNA 2-thiouridine synthesizing protein A